MAAYNSYYKISIESDEILETQKTMSLEQSTEGFQKI